MRRRDFVQTDFFPGDGDGARATTASPRLASSRKIELEKGFLLSFSFFFLRSDFSCCVQCTTPGPISRQRAQVQTGCPPAAPGFSIVIIDFNLETKVSDLLELVCSMTCKVGSEVIFGQL